MKHTINIKGVIIPNNYKWYYNLFEMDSTCVKDVQDIMDQVKDGDEVEVYINSPGGVIDVGSEIYTLLRKHSEKVKIYITGEACSAASVIAMAAYSEMAPTALMMVHCVSSGVNGNHSDMEHMAETLRTADKALSSAYVDKTGMSEEEILQIMENETWLTADQALERGLIDKVMFREEESKPFVAGPLFALPSNEQMEKAKEMMKNTSGQDDILLQTKLNLMKLKKGEM